MSNKGDLDCSIFRWLFSRLFSRRSAEILLALPDLPVQEKTDQTRPDKVGKVGKVDKLRKVGKVEKLGKIGKLRKVAKVQKL